MSKGANLLTREKMVILMENKDLNVKTAVVFSVTPILVKVIIRIVKQICLNMYLNGMGFRGIERVTGIHHTTIINWVKESGKELPEDESEEPELAELDELQTYIGRKIDKIWIWTAINHHAPGILAMEIGDRSGQTFNKLWEKIETWNTRKYLTDGYCVYANYIEPEKH